ncbi:hypothetical protein Tco_1154881 [Tanacetum coccineum]
MSNNNNNLQTQTSSSLHNAIMEVGGKYRPLMLAPGIDNDIYSTVDGIPNAMEMWIAIEQLKHGTRYDRQTGQYDNQRVVNVAEARENVGTQKPKRAKDSAYHKENMLLCKQEEARIQLSAEQADWKDESDDEPKNQELEAYYMYMAKVQEVIPEDADNFGPIFNTKPLKKVHTADDHYDVFANERQHPEQPETINDTYVVEQDDSNISPDSSNMCSDKGDADQDYIDQERVLLAFLIEKLKCCSNDNLALMLAPESDETIRLAQESRSN